MKSGAQKPRPSTILDVSAAGECPPRPPRRKVSVGERPPFPDVIPFEWFHQGDYLDQKKNPVLLLWIDERALFTSPILSLADLRCQINSSSLEGGGAGFVLIGPQQSRTLARMANELHRDPRSPADCEQKKLSLVLKNFVVYNPSATTKEAQLLKEATLPRVPKIDQIFREENIKYYRTVSTDETLAKASVAELKLRQVDPAASADHIALISEWDTLYGRILPEAFEACFGNATSINCEGSTPLSVTNRIHQFSYMRGLDGQLLHTKSAGTHGLQSRPRQRCYATVQRSIDWHDERWGCRKGAGGRARTVRLSPPTCSSNPGARQKPS